MNPDIRQAVTTAPWNSIVIEVSVVTPYIINTIGGVIIVPKEPDAQIMPIDIS